jgi:hypothetical protein
MTILMLCWEGNLCNTLGFYAKAFRKRGIHVVCARGDFAWNTPLDRWLPLCPEHPALILHPEADVPFLPWGLTETEILTACFQVDTYAYTKRRIAWSKLFDLPLVFHPGYDAAFREGGHPGAQFLPHAVDEELFAQPETERIYDVGWVGQTRGPMYRTRQPILDELAKSFRMNDFARRYTAGEMAAIYRQSKIVVNVGRDDYPQDANTRTFEAMAAGAMLITVEPSELSGIGFQEGVHFIGYRKATEINPLVEKYLEDEPARRKITHAARERVLREHVYEQRVNTLLRLIDQAGKERLAPARGWREDKVRLAYLDYFVANGAMECAVAELPRIARHSLRNAAAGAALVTKTLAGQAWQRARMSFTAS